MALSTLSGNRVILTRESMPLPSPPLPTDPAGASLRNRKHRPAYTNPHQVPELPGNRHPPDAPAAIPESYPPAPAQTDVHSPSAAASVSHLATPCPPPSTPAPAAPGKKIRRPRSAAFSPPAPAENGDPPDNSDKNNDFPYIPPLTHRLLPMAQVVNPLPLPDSVPVSTRICPAARNPGASPFRKGRGRAGKGKVAGIRCRWPIFYHRIRRRLLSTPARPALRQSKVPPRTATAGKGTIHPQRRQLRCCGRGLPRYWSREC